MFCVRVRLLGTVGTVILYLEEPNLLRVLRLNQEIIAMSKEENDVEKSGDSKAQKKSRHNDGAADLEKVTDYEEERVVMSQDITGAINLIDSRRSKEAAEKQAKERELAKVSIKKEDVEVLIKETEIPRNKAERILRENDGNLVSALLQVVNS